MRTVLSIIAYLFVLDALIMFVLCAVGSRNDREDEVEYTPTPSAPRPIYGKADHYDVDVTTGTVSYHVVTTNADRIRSMTDEELALWLAKFTDCSECPISAYPHCTTSDEACACGWHEWLKEEVNE